MRQIEDLDHIVESNRRFDSVLTRSVNLVSVNYSEGPPVPIPNTEVKLVCAYNTWLDTARDDRSMLTPSRTLYRAREGLQRGPLAQLVRATGS